MRPDEKVTEELTGIRSTDIEAALDPAETDGVYRDSRECGGVLLNLGGGLLSPPTPRPKKG
ncbi:hypothetical protein ACFUIT_28830 [Streptomyces sp. NPDC057239]|uniref:hypothetical protein n=1 Tax=Streptomyces sp. NPDC057239 TaxID=3346061 RepID=UPI003642D64F